MSNELLMIHMQLTPVLVRPLSNVEFLMSAEHLFLAMKVIKAQLNTAVDSHAGYDGAELNSVCCKYSQSL